MSGEAYLLDSVILIDHLNAVDDATEFLESCSGSCSLTAITRAEVLAGVEPDAEKPVRQLLDRIPFIVIDQALADSAASLRRSYRWKLPDAFQAAAARIHGLKLATRNTKDFPPDKFGFVFVPYEL